MRLCIIAHQQVHRLTGHLPEYVSSIVQEACSRGWRVDLCTSPEMCEYVRSSNGNPPENLRLFPQQFVSPWIGTAKLIAIQQQMWGWIKTIRAYCTVPAMRNCDHLLIVDGDHIAYAIGLFGLPLFRCGVSTIVLGTLDRTAGITRPVRSLEAKARLAVIRRFLRYKKLRGIITTNPTFAAIGQVQPTELMKRVHYVEEIEPQWNIPMAFDKARGILGIDAHWRVVLCYGELTAGRKGLPQLFAAVDHPDMGDVLILLVGTPNASTERLLQSNTGKRLKANGQIREIFGYVSPECERTSFSASDAVWIGYPNFRQPSGVLEIARASGVPIVASNGGVIGSMVEQYGLGSVVDVTDPRQSRRALSECFMSSKRRKRSTATYVESCDDSGMNHRGFGGRICDVIFALESAGIATPELSREGVRREQQDSRRRPRVVIGHPMIGFGGSEAVLMWLIEALKRDHDVTVLSAGGWNLAELNAYYSTNVKEDEVKFRLAPVPWPARNLSAATLRGACFQRFARRIAGEYDVRISAYNAIDWGLPAIHFIADFSWHRESRERLDPLPGFIYRDSIFRRAYLRIAGACGNASDRDLLQDDVVIANSTWTARLIHQACGGNCAAVIYPPVWAEFPQVPWEKKENAFVMIGRIAPEKRIEDAIAILEGVRARGHAIRLHLCGEIGSDDYGRKISQLCRERKDWIVVEGRVSGTRKSQILANCRFGLQTRSAEAFGISVAEMVKAGAIVFAPNDGGQVEIVDHPGLLFANKGEALEKLCAVLASAAQRAELRGHLSAQARRLSADTFMQHARECIVVNYKAQA